jgi:alpha-glucosidase
MLQVRREYSDILVAGDFDIMDMENLDLFTFTKAYRGKKAYIVCNFTGKKQAMDLSSEFGDHKVKLLASSVEGYEDRKLAAYEGRVYLLT